MLMPDEARALADSDALAHLDVTFHPMDDPPPGVVVRIAVERLGGVGPWAA